MTDPIQQRVRTAVSAALDKKAFDLDVLAVSELTSIPLMLVVHPSVPATNLKELVTLLKANPGKRHIVTSAVEHSSVLNYCRALEGNHGLHGSRGLAAKKARRGARSAGVLACEFTGRPAPCSFERRDAARTRSRDGCATSLPRDVSAGGPGRVAETGRFGKRDHG